jgi:hypothetical protein
MELKITRWNQPVLPTEGELQEIYRQEGLSPYAWSNGPGDVYSAHQHSYHKVRIDLPRGTLHAARVGSRGVTCLEAHLS